MNFLPNNTKRIRSMANVTINLVFNLLNEESLWCTEIKKTT